MWDKFRANRYKVYQPVVAHVSGEQRSTMAPEVWLTFRAENGKRLPVLMSLDEASLIGRALVKMADPKIWEDIRVKERPANYAELTPERQWEIDKKLGILDRNGNSGDVAQAAEHATDNRKGGSSSDSITTKLK